MALQTSGSISLLNVQGEFGGSNPISINEYYGADSGVPTSGTIGLNNFYGKSAFQVESYTFTKREFFTGGKFGDYVLFNGPPGLTNAQRLRSVGLSYYNNALDPSGLTFKIGGFPDASGYIACMFSVQILTGGTFAGMSGDQANWDSWWRYARVYNGSSLIYQFDRQNPLEHELTPESQDLNTSDSYMQYGQGIYTTQYYINPTMANLTMTISNA